MERCHKRSASPDSLYEVGAGYRHARDLHTTRCRGLMRLSPRSGRQKGRRAYSDVQRVCRPLRGLAI